MAERKLDIFRVLSEIDKKNTNFYDSLSEEEQKAFLPLIVGRWLSGTFNKQQVFLINEVVNPFIFSLYKHPKLLFYLMILCTNGKQQRYVWNKALARTPTHPLSIKVIQQYFGYNKKDAEQVINVLPPEDLILFAEEMGWQDDDLNKTRKELGLKTVRSGSRVAKNIKKPIDSDFEF